MPLVVQRAALVAAAVTVAALLGSFWWHVGGLLGGVVVTDAGTSPVNGYYLYLGSTGAFLQSFHQLGWAVPDAFRLVGIKPKVTAESAALFHNPRGGGWLLGRPPDSVYYASPEETSGSEPPLSGWQVTQAKKGGGQMPAPHLQVCGRVPQPQVGGSQGKAGQGISEVRTKPATYLLTAIILAAAYHLWNHRVDPASVSISYSKFLTEREYWRAVTATFSHFEVMHLMFNTMSLVNLGELETLMGSFSYLYLSIDLVATTILVVIFIQHVMIKRYGMEAEREKSAVGYSCVLFALMVYASGLQKKFCPIPFFDKFCFNTWFLPTPFKGVKLPVNLAPVALLLLAQLIPRTGFLGHLAGIIMGYPLAWGLLDWLTTPLLSAMATLAMLHHGGSWPWRMQDYRVLLQNWAEGEPQRVRWTRAFLTLEFCQLVLVLLVGWQFPPSAGVAEVSLLFVAWCTGRALQCCACPDTLQEEHRCCLTLLKAYGLNCCLFAAVDLLNLGALAGGWCFLEAGGISQRRLLTALCTLLLSLAVHLGGVGLCVKNALHFREGQSLLASWGFHRLVTHHTVINAFEGQGRLLGAAGGGRSVGRMDTGSQRLGLPAPGGARGVAPTLSQGVAQAVLI